MRSLCIRDLVLAGIFFLATAGLGNQSACANDSWKTYYPKLDQTAKKTVIVFIPGILGSRLIDPETNEVVWGDFDITSSVPNLEVKEGKKFKSEPFLTADIRALFRLGGYSVYGDAIKQIEKDGAATNSVLLKFHYDWRQSNYESAIDLEAWLCGESNASLIKDSNLLFVAHSMGGIVLKHWFHRFFDKGEGCINKNTAAQNVLKVTLVGTPHFGSAKIIRNFFDGYSFGIPLADNRLSQRINRFGHTFPSIYELIPIQNNLACGSELEQFTGGTALEVEESATGTKYDLFSIETYKALSIPKTISETARKQFVENDLAPILEKAKALGCFAAKYDFPNLERDRIITYAGFLGSENTPAAYKVLKDPLIWPPDSRSGSFYLEVTRMERGDGTVTQRAAKWASVVTEVDLQKDCRSEHGGLMDDVGVTNYLAAVSQNAFADELKRGVSHAGSYDQFIKEAASQHRIVEVSPLLSEKNTEFIAKLNSDIFKSAGITADGIWELRKTVENQSAERFAVNWAYLASEARSGDRTLEAYEDIGTSLITQRHYDLAIARLSDVIEIWNSTSSRTSVMAEVAGAAYNVRGSLNFELQNAARSRDDWIAAESLGVTVASENLVHWKIQYGSPLELGAER